MPQKTKPKFSVIIPTYNRAHLLPFALQSVLQQTVEDFEIVISNGGSTDNTAEVVKNFDDPRIRYFESESRLPVGDNYQNGLNHTRGEYITFLSDDDAYTPELLSTVKKTFESTTADIVSYQYCRYYHDVLYEFDRSIPKNSLLIHEYDGNLTEFSGQEAVEQALAGAALSTVPKHPRYITPYLSNATYHRSIFDKLLNIRNNLFDFVPPDMYLAVAVFYLAETYVCLDLPLLVWSSWAGNMSMASTRRNSNIKEHNRQMMKGRNLRFTPLKFPLYFNCSVECALTAADDFKVDPDSFEWAVYFKTIYENFVYLRSTGVDLKDEMDEFERVLASQPDTVKASVEEFRGDTGFRFRSYLNIHTPRFAAFARRCFKLRKQMNATIIPGETANFSSVSSAAKNVFSNQSKLSL